MTDDCSVFTFVHITDIHLREKKYTFDYSRFEYFLHDLLPIIDPQIVIATGDLTNGVTESNKGIQLEEQWTMYFFYSFLSISTSYSELLKKYNMFTPEKWLDVKGNHDSRNCDPVTVDYPLIHTVFGSNHFDKMYPYQSQLYLPLDI